MKFKVIDIQIKTLADTNKMINDIVRFYFLRNYFTSALNANETLELIGQSSILWPFIIFFVRELWIK